METVCGGCTLNDYGPTRCSQLRAVFLFKTYLNEVVVFLQNGGGEEVVEEQEPAAGKSSGSRVGLGESFAAFCRFQVV